MNQTMKPVIFLFIFYISSSSFADNFHQVFEEQIKIPCETDQDCETHEQCNAELFCQCKSDHNCQNTALVNSVVTTKLGEQCHIDNDCNIQGAFCDRNESKCVCLDGLVPLETGKLCLPTVKTLSESCVEDIQCNQHIPNSVCSQSVCSCSIGMHSYNNTCYKDVDLGDSCHTAAECVTAYSECNEGLCSCSRRYIPVDAKQCLLAANSFLSPCKRNEQCTATMGVGSHCYNDVCNCMYMYQFKASTKKCVQDMTLGEDCKEHSDCHQPGSDASRLLCILNECKCKTPLFKELDGNCVERSGSGSAIENIPVMMFNNFVLIFAAKILM